MNAKSLSRPTYKETSSLSTRQLLAYVLPLVPLYLLLGPIVILPGIYAKYFGVSLASVATIIVLARVFDTVTDLLIGYCSDNYYARKGTRKPFVLIGGVLFVVSSYFLYVPVDTDALTATTQVSETYFLVWMFAFYLSLTLFFIPHQTWGSEITSTAQERNKLFGFAIVAVTLGQVLFFSVPLLGIFESSEFTPQILEWSVFAVGLLVLPTLVICLKKVPNSHCPQRQSQGQEKHSPGLKKNLLCLASNQPFLLFITAFFLFHVGFGMWATLLFIFVDSYLGWGSQIALAYGLSYGIGALSVWLWYRFANRLGKKLTWVVGVLLSLVGLLGTGLLSPEMSWLLLLAFMVITYIGIHAIYTVAPSLLSDIIDYDTWKFGSDQAAIYFSAYSVSSKISVAIGGALSLAIAGGYGFDPASSVHSKEAISGLRLAMVWLPIPFLLVAIGLIVRIPINARRHRIIRQSLDARAARAVTSAKPYSAQTPKPDTSTRPEAVFQGADS